MPAHPLPLGIRNNNPGNLRRATVADTQSVIVNNFAVFRSTSDGLLNLAHMIRRHINSPEGMTLLGFVHLYAPPSENNTLAYVALIERYLRRVPGTASMCKMSILKDWDVLDLMRGIIRMENGIPPRAFDVGGEWFAPNELWAAIQKDREL